MDFDTWYDQQYEQLADSFVKENPELNILDDDMSDLHRNGSFQTYVENKFAEKIAEAIK